LRFEVGCDLEELREYWNGSGYDGNFDYLMNVVIKDSSQLIVWREDNKVVGHSVWHESNTEEHRQGDPREKEDIKVLEKYRGKGYGEMFHAFFEKFMKDKGYYHIVFYAHHPAAVAICRKQGYREGGYLKGLNEYVFYLSLK
jgi:GNAT superfamily N-acetyltransferase